MEVAWHVANTMAEEDFNDFPKNLRFAYHGIDEVNNAQSYQAGTRLTVKQKECPDRLYVGDEFCRFRLPSPKPFSTLLELADDAGIPLTFMTPVLTDQGIARCVSLFDCLQDRNPSSEVVVNDLGVLVYLKTHYPGFKLSMGRLFNKGFKDPRLTLRGKKVSHRSKDILTAATFDQEHFQQLARSLGIHRLERDLLPFETPEAFPSDIDSDFGGGIDALPPTYSQLKLRGNISIYLPFGYVTTGRACFSAGLNGEPGKRFAFNAPCSSPCRDQGLKLSRPERPDALFQSGNTIFYRYTDDRIQALLNQATDSNDDHDIRLVLQGGISHHSYSTGRNE